jgi:hypothetical protein
MGIVDHPGREPATGFVRVHFFNKRLFSFSQNPVKVCFFGPWISKLLILGQNHAIHLDRIEPSTDDATRRSLSEKTESPLFA